MFDRALRNWGGKWIHRHLSRGARSCSSQCYCTALVLGNRLPTRCTSLIRRAGIP